MAIRIVGAVIMVRVGGGWEELEKYLSSPSASFFKQCVRCAVCGVRCAVCVWAWAALAA